MSDREGLEETQRLMEKLRAEGKMDLRVNPESGEIEGTLTEAGEEEARKIWCRLLDLPEDTPASTLDPMIADAAEKLGLRPPDGEDRG